MGGGVGVRGRAEPPARALRRALPVAQRRQPGRVRQQDPQVPFPSGRPARRPREAQAGAVRPSCREIGGHAHAEDPGPLCVRGGTLLEAAKHDARRTGALHRRSEFGRLEGEVLQRQEAVPAHAAEQGELGRGGAEDECVGDPDRLRDDRGRIDAQVAMNQVRGLATIARLVSQRDQMADGR